MIEQINYEEILNIKQNFGMLAKDRDIFYFKKFLEILPRVDNFLELGTFIGGGLLFFNSTLSSIGQKCNFTVVDHLEEYGPNFNNFLNNLTPEELNEIKNITTSNQSLTFIKNRSKRLTHLDINLRWYLNVDELDNQKYDVIFQDFNLSKDQCLNLIVNKLNDDGIYVVDDWNSSHVQRLFLILDLINDKKLFPVLWGKDKVFLTKDKDYALSLIRKIQEKNFKFLHCMPQLSASIDYNTLMDNGN